MLRRRGGWDPGGAFIQDVAQATSGTRESCQSLDPSGAACTWDTDPADPDVNFRDSGKPYYQMVLGCDGPFVAFSMAVMIDGGASVQGRTAWCTETVSYWHKHAFLPYPGGYRTDWYLDWQVYGAMDLLRWYAIEGGWENGRGRWIHSRDVEYEDFEPGVTAPVPGAYVAIRGYEYGHPDEWLGWGETGHSLMVDEMWVHRGFGGRGCRVEVALQEGNSRDRVRADRRWDDVRALTPQGDGWIGNRKIFGFGIDLDAGGEPLYDPARLHYIDTNTICALPTTQVSVAIDPWWDEQQTQKVATYATLVRAAGGPQVTSAPDTLGLNAVPDGAGTRWVFPAGLAGPVEVVIDLRYRHPFPVKGVELRWRGGFLPLGYGVEFAGEDGVWREAEVPHSGQLGLPPQASVIPVPCRFPGDGDGGVPVRFVWLVFPDGTFVEEAALEELRFAYATGGPEDATTHPDGTHLGLDTTGAYAEPAVLWPPSHTFQEIRVRGVVDPEGTPVAVRVAGVTQDEPVDGPGDGAFAPDAVLQGETAAWVRAERSGKGNGRVYGTHFVATDAEGASNLGSVTVSVPHDRKRPAVDDGQVYDATQ